MCGIIGYLNQENSLDKVKLGLKILRNRGKDNYGISNLNKTHNFAKISELNEFNDNNFKDASIIAHCLHPIVNIIKQPLSNKFVFNGEIYNWNKLKEKYQIKAKNDAELLLGLIEKIGFEQTLNELDGVYAIVYYSDSKLYLARDIIGVKPLFYSFTDGFSFASEKKALENSNILSIEELNPRKIIIYDLKTQEINLKQRSFLKLTPIIKDDYNEIKKQTQELLIESIKKRIPTVKFGVLFSGGIDSTLIVKILKNLGYEFNVYTAAVNDPMMKDPEDLVYAKKIAKDLDLNLKITTIKLNEVDKYLKKIVPLIEDSNVVKVEVALPFFLASERAKKDGCKVLFSGLGSEELFAGYQRHRNSNDLNAECLSGLLKIYERDLYRDDVITMYNNIELRLPFLDLNLAKYAVRIPGKYKIKDDIVKYIIRDFALDLGIDKKYAFRKKKAAQYGSNFSKAISKLARQDKFKYKSEYLKQFFPKANVKLGVLFSGGKDSVYALYIMKRMNYEISALISLKSKNKFSYMFHTPNIDLVEMQAKSLNLPLILQETLGVEDNELDDLEIVLKKAKDKYDLGGIVTGALYSIYQRNRIEKIADKLGLKIFSPLWHIDQTLEVKQLVENNFKVILSSIAADGLNKDDLGKVIDSHQLDRFVKLEKKIGFNVAGEGGEYETLVLDCPLFEKEIKIVDSKIIMEKEYSGFYVIKKAVLIDKEFIKD